jgi:hypothetical protein
MFADVLAALYAYAEADPVGGLSALAREGGPWVFVTVVVVSLQWYWSRQSIARADQRAAEWKAVADTHAGAVLTALGELKSATALLRSIEQEAKLRRGEDREGAD